jgi:hypothetical protein
VPVISTVAPSGTSSTIAAFRLGAARNRAPSPPVPVIFGPGPTAGAGTAGAAGGAGGGADGAGGAAGGAGGSAGGAGWAAAATPAGSPNHSAEDQPARERQRTWNQTIPSALVSGPPVSATTEPWGK